MPSQTEGEKIQRLQADAESGIPRAQRHLANRYLRGRGLPQDRGLAATWMRRAAERGLATAQRSYGEFLEAGVGVEPDPEAAWVWFERAAVQGDPIAQRHLLRRDL